MSVTIRVQPQYGQGGMYGAAGTTMYYTQQLASQQKMSALQLAYERALNAEKLKTVQLQSALKYGVSTPQPVGNPYGVSPYGVMSPYLMNGSAYAAAMPGGFNSFAQPGMGYLPMAGGSGQSNYTNQVATGAANQTVTNSNTYTNPGFPSPYGYGQGIYAPYGYGGYQNQGGSWLSRLFGWL